MTTNSARYALFVSCLAYLALGGFTAAMGPLVPEIARQMHASLAEIGAVFTALFFGGLISQLVAGPASDRFGQRPILLIGLGLMAMGGVGIISSRSLGWLLPLAVLAGLGHGSVDISCNLLIARIFARRKVSALNVLHLFFGLGSVIGPAAVSLSLIIRGVGMPALVALTIVSALLLPLAYALRVSSGADEVAVDDRSIPVYRSPLLWAFSGLIAVYVGIEMGVGGWTTTYIQDTLGMAIQAAALVTSAYWLALTGGRLISALLGTRLGPYRILTLDFAGTILGAASLVLGTGNRPLTIGATMLIGLSFGSIYPTVMALVTTIFRATPGKAASVITASGSLGGMSLPLLMGVLLTGRGAASSPWFALACCLAMSLLYVALTALRTGGAPRYLPVQVAEIVASNQEKDQ